MNSFSLSDLTHYLAVINQPSFPMPPSFIILLLHISRRLLGLMHGQHKSLGGLKRCSLLRSNLHTYKSQTRRTEKKGSKTLLA